MRQLVATLIVSSTLASLPVWADPPAITKVAASQATDGWRFEVTLSHPDTGWEHYADGWRVLDMQGVELGLRILAHPHVNELPFTRSLGEVKIPRGTKQVKIQARCLVDGWAAQILTTTLP